MVIGGLRFRFQVERTHSGYDKPYPNNCANVKEGHRAFCPNVANDNVVPSVKGWRYVAVLLWPVD